MEFKGTSSKFIMVALFHQSIILLDEKEQAANSYESAVPSIQAFRSQVLANSIKTVYSM
jgi:hypothetical protein